VISFNATVMSKSLTASVAATPEGYLVGTNGIRNLYPRSSRALNAVRDYLGSFLGMAERNRELAWSLSVSVSAGTAFYGTRPPTFAGGGGVPVAPAEQLVKIRERYSEGDGPIAALQNALQIARAYPPDAARRAA
jgi:hypothetical protein